MAAAASHVDSVFQPRETECMNAGRIQTGHGSTPGRFSGPIMSCLEDILFVLVEREITRTAAVFGGALC